MTPAKDDFDRRLYQLPTPRTTKQHTSYGDARALAADLLIALREAQRALARHMAVCSEPNSSRERR